MTDALVTAPTLTWAQVIFPPGSTREAMAAASVIACVTTLFLFLFLFLSIHILRSAKLLSKSCINGTTKSIYYETCHPTCRWVLLHPSAQSISRLKWLLLLTEFIGGLEHKFPRSFIVKYSAKVDSSSSLQATQGRLAKNIEGEHHLKLKKNDELSFLFALPGSPNVSCGVVFSMKEVTWILKYKNIIGERNALVLRTTTKTMSRVELASSLMIYGNTWSPKNRREPNVRPNVSWSFPWSLLIFFRVLQPTSRWNLIIRSKDYVSGSSLRYDILTAGIFIFLV